jgi:hypothetical protein
MKVLHGGRSITHTKNIRSLCLSFVSEILDYEFVVLFECDELRRMNKRRKKVTLPLLSLTGAARPATIIARFLPP